LVAVSSTSGTSDRVTRTPVLQISATMHMALVQGIYDLGEPGREAVKPVM
jgi:hypothetical protein